ncbi:MAG TPA: sulfotransferase, partial [Trebonia sp.]
FRPSVVNIDTECPSPFYGVEDESDRLLWPSLSDAGKSALRWRGAIRLAARLRRELPQDQLKTLRYEDMLREPKAAAAALSGFTGMTVAAPAALPGKRAAAEQAVKRAAPEQNEWRRTLSYSQLADVEKVAGEELRRLGYR